MRASRAPDARLGNSRRASKLNFSARQAGHAGRKREVASTNPDGKQRGRASGLLICLTPVLLICGACAHSEAGRRDFISWADVSLRMRSQVSHASHPSSRELSAETRQRLALRAEAARDSIVQVIAEGRGGAGEGDAVTVTGSSGRGSGVIACTGAVITCEHVVRGAGRIRVLLQDGTSLSVSGVHVHPTADLAMLSVPGLRGCAGLPTAASPPAGSCLVSLGATPSGVALRAGVLTRGSVDLQNDLDPARGRDYSALIEIAARIEPGFSGGPVLDENGCVVAINVGTTNAPGAARAFAAPLDDRIHKMLAAGAPPARTDARSSR